MPLTELETEMLAALKAGLKVLHSHQCGKRIQAAMMREAIAKAEVKHATN